MTKSEFLTRVAKAWLKEPELRLGQFIACAMYDDALATHPRLRELFYVSDSKLLEALEGFVAEPGDE